MKSDAASYTISIILLHILHMMCVYVSVLKGERERERIGRGEKEKDYRGG